MMEEVAQQAAVSVPPDWPSQAIGTYIGTKIIKVIGHEIREGVAGYLVEYGDGYTSWSPWNAFEQAYRRYSNMTFGLAVEAVKKGLKVGRAGWNGKGMFVFLVPGSTFKVNRAPLLGIYPEGTEIVYGAHIDIKAVDGSVRPWVASQSDMLAEDWIVIE